MHELHYSIMQRIIGWDREVVYLHRCGDDPHSSLLGTGIVSGSSVAHTYFSNFPIAVIPRFFGKI